MMRMMSCLSFVAAFLCIDSWARADRAVLENRQEQLLQILDEVSPAVVSVTDGVGFGTGVVVTEDGIVLTASHVVESNRRVRRRLEVIFADGTTARCQLLGRNRYCDAAVLRIIDKPTNGDGFPHVSMGRSSDVERGDWCFALGHPGGRRDDRPAVLRFGRALAVSDQTIVSDNAIVLGDSGGPLFDLKGRVIGIHSMITRIIVENRHVAIDVWHRDWDRLLNGDAWGKLRVNEDELASSRFVGVGLRWNDYQAKVKRIASGSPAAKAGFRPGDELLKVGGRTFADRLGLSSLLARLEENEEVAVTVRRRGREETLTVVTGHRPDSDRTSAEMTPEDREFVREIEEELAQEFQSQIGFERRVGSNEKREHLALRDYSAITRRTSGSVVRFKSNDQQIAFGIVMTDDGEILTKASEVMRAKDPVCVLPDGSEQSFQKIGSDNSWDVMLVKVNAAGLTPLEWSDKRPSTGRLLISPDSRGRPLLPGVVSIPPLVLPTSTQGFLGVRLERRSYGHGVRVADLLEGGAAQRDGIESGDVIMSINGKSVSSTPDTIHRIKNFAPNQQINIRVLRGELIRKIAVTLTPRFVSDGQDALLKQYTTKDLAGQYASIHNSGFPQVIQHDTDLFPHQCGGPVLDISGRAVGMNIARAARIISYAIPADAVREVYASLRENKLAAHNAR
ncbi:MAG: trypsin-like peptidase domain-containing protein [Planctomycetaceae bacterium]|jgi:serine protease Do